MFGSKKLIDKQTHTYHKGYYSQKISEVSNNGNHKILEQDYF